MAVSKTRRTRILGAATAFIGVGAAGLMMAAPASAAVTSVKVTTPSGYGSSEGKYGTSCEYDVEVAINNAIPAGTVSYRVVGPNGQVGATQTKTPSGNKATFKFAPTVPGTYTLEARQSDNEKTNPEDPEGPKIDAWVSSDELSVGQGIAPPDTGSVALPLTDACIVLG